MVIENPNVLIFRVVPAPFGTLSITIVIDRPMAHSNDFLALGVSTPPLIKHDIIRRHNEPICGNAGIHTEDDKY